MSSLPEQPQHTAWDELHAQGVLGEIAEDREDKGSLDLFRSAEYLGISPSALHRLLDSGTLPWIRNGDLRQRRIRVVDLDRHRDDRYDLRHRLAAEARQLRSPGPDLVGT